MSELSTEEEYRALQQQWQIPATNAVGPAMNETRPVSAPTDSTTSFDKTKESLGTAVQQEAPTGTSTVSVDDGRKATDASETKPADSDAVKIAGLQEQYKMETALRVKGIDSALAVWKDRTDYARKLQEREDRFSEWERQHDIMRRDQVTDKILDRILSSPLRQNYQMSFSNGRLTSFRTKVGADPYADMLQKILDQTNSGSGVALPTRGSSAPDMPDWLKPLVDGPGSRKGFGELDVKPAEAPAKTDARGQTPTVSMTAYGRQYLGGGKFGTFSRSSILYRDGGQADGSVTVKKTKKGSGLFGEW